MNERQCRAWWAAMVLLGACSEPRAPVVPVAIIEPRSAPPAAEEVVVPAEVTGSVARLAVGHSRACLVRRDGTVVCWGAPIGTTQLSPDPTVVRGLTDVVQIAGDSFQWCARRKDGTVLCWTEPNAPERVAISGAIDVSGGCAVLAAGSVSCWDEGKVAPLPFIHGARALSHRASVSSGYVLLGDGSIACWGLSYRSLCNGNPQPESGPLPAWPLRVDIDGRVVHVDDDPFVGGACAVARGAVWCWGGEHGGAPARREAFDKAVAVAVAEYHECARLADGTVVCEGANSSGQLGGGDDQSALVVPPVRDVIEVRAGGGEPCGGCGSTCVLTAQGDVLCWGQLNGQTQPTRVDVAGAH